MPPRASSKKDSGKLTALEQRLYSAALESPNNVSAFPRTAARAMACSS